MHRINLYQTLLTEGQWSYINEVFFENDCRKRKIHYGAYSKRYYTYWSQDVSGGCFRTIIPSGNWCTITSGKWSKEGRIEHLLNKLVRKVRKKRNQSESPSVGALMPRALNGATVRVTMDLTQTRRSRASNVTSWLTAMALFLPDSMQCIGS